MNILTPTEISECLTGGPTAVARAIEAAVIKRLVELEKQEPVGYASKEDIAELQSANGMSVWCESTNMWGGAGDPPLPSDLIPIFAAAGASPVEPSESVEHRDELAKRKPEPAAETVGGLAKAVKAARGGDAPPAPMRRFA